MQTQEIFLENLDQAAKFLLEGEVVAFPTETVYGLGACLFQEKAVQKIFTAKGRPSDNPLIAHVSRLSGVEEIARDIPPVFFQLAERFFPGPLTVILSKKKQVPFLVSAGLETVAVRMPNHPVALELIERVGSPLVAPSANLSGKPSATQASHVLDDFRGKIAAVVVGASSEIGIESTVVSLLGGNVEILRPGAVLQEEIEEYLGRRIAVFDPKKLHLQPLPSPGMKYRHYAPEARVRLFLSLEEAFASFEKNGVPQRSKILSNHASLAKMASPLKPSSFYAELRLADQRGCEEVVIVCDEETLRHLGFMDRLHKAAGS